jgi:hypothetical protein
MILDFEKPQKIRSTDKHNEMFSSDSGVAGTYVPNMSEDDTKKFKAKHITGDHERVEIRVSMGVNVVIIVYKKPYPVKWDYTKQDEYRKRHLDIQFSVNGKLDITFDQWSNINQAIEEAKQILGI